MKASQDKALVVFRGKQIRRTWHKDEWWFSLFDIVVALTESSDSKQYVKKMRQRDPILSANWGTFCTLLELVAPDGKSRKANCVNTRGAFRLIQSIPSKKAEPFKQWLAQIGHERIQEVENPELAQDRAKKYYELKGYPKDWIDKRIRGIAIRQELTDEWKQRGVDENTEFAILTNEISQATFGVPIKRHKQIKQLDPKFKNQNLRDHMTDLELIFSMLGERLTTEATRKKDAQGFVENKEAAREGGGVAGRAKKDAEASLGIKVVSKENYLDLHTKNKKLVKKL
ncbi:phage antirepressor protein [Candidatus Woesearchaeota archaeon]|nr:phage antirepressor protein [Candidatus Woesearchaeota archaeon]